MRWFKNQPVGADTPRKAPAPLPAVDLQSEIRLGWGVPSYGPIYAQVYSSHLSVIQYASRYMAVTNLGKIPLVGCTDRMYLHQAANEIVKQAQAAKLTHLFWTETDMLLPHDTIPKLLALDVDIAAGVYFLRGGTGQPCLFMTTPFETRENPYLHTPIRVYDERAPFKVHCPGMGCALMRMSVFDRVRPPWFDLKANDEGKQNGYGQDLYFFTKVRKAGIDVWVDPSVICDQIDTQIIGYADYRRHLAESQVGAGGHINCDPGPENSSAA